MDTRDSTEIVVAGGGMAGLVAAAQAGLADCDVLLLEKAPHLGGSMKHSEGVIWSYVSMDVLTDVLTEGDRDLQRLVIENRKEDLTWLDETVGANVREPDVDVTKMTDTAGKQIDPQEFIPLMKDRIQGLGGKILLETGLEELHLNEGGSISGVTVQDDGSHYIQTDAVILATGGWQGNEELVERYISTNTDNLWLRSNPWSTGDGMIAAKDVGAKTTKGFDHFYGHNLPAPPATFSWDELRNASQLYGPRAIAVDHDGTRYVDESRAGEEVIAQKTLKLANGRAAYILDHELYESPSEKFIGDHVGAHLERLPDYGVEPVVADTFDEFAARIDEHGFAGGQTVRTIKEYNEAIRSEKVDDLDIGRQGNRYPIDTPPFYFVEMQPGITFTHGGLAASEDMEVLRRSSSASTLAGSRTYYRDDEASSVRSEPIDGLFAAGVDIGNISHENYMGGLAQALVTGRIAARNAAAVSGASD